MPLVPEKPLAMEHNSRHVVFDIEGTIVSHDRVFDAIDTCLGTALSAEGVKSSLLGYTWFEVAEREYTYCSMSGNYVPFIKVFRALFYRILWMAGIQQPRKFATEEDLNYIMNEYAALDPRPGAKECIEILRRHGYKVWAFTAGDREQVKGYFDKAGIEMPLQDVLACDSSAIAKPDLRSYEALLRAELSDASEVWFAAAHMWDVSAARRAGFTGAYCSIFEGEPLHEIFGDMDVVSDSLVDMASKIVSFQR